MNDKELEKEAREFNNKALHDLKVKVVAQVLENRILEIARHTANMSAFDARLEKITDAKTTLEVESMQASQGSATRY